MRVRVTSTVSQDVNSALANNAVDANGKNWVGQQMRAAVDAALPPGTYTAAHRVRWCPPTATR